MAANTLDGQKRAATPGTSSSEALSEQGVRLSAEERRWLSDPRVDP